MRYLLIFFISLYSFSQKQYDYLGVIELDTKKKGVISYRILFTEKNGVIDGYSVTDLNGAHETKNKISGRYNSKTKSFSFKEDRILYTKSPLSKESFCFMNFSGTVDLNKENSQLVGNFKGLFPNKTKCIDGSLKLFAVEKVEKKMTKLNKRIQRTKFVDEQTKAKANPLKLLDSLKVNSLGKNQDLKIFVTTAKVTIEIWDAQLEDGDQIDLTHNGKYLLQDFEVKNAKKVIKLNLAPGNNYLTVTALNEGTQERNTAMIRVIEGDRTFELTTNLKQREKAMLTLVQEQ